jgi:hypothetical protein
VRGIDGPNGDARLGRLPCLFLLVLLVFLAPIASASPPDPAWIPGIYDGADYDDVIGLITAADSASSGAAPLRERPEQIVAGSSQEAFDEVVLSVSLPPSGPRSPPPA